MADRIPPAIHDTKLCTPDILAGVSSETYSQINVRTPELGISYRMLARNGKGQTYSNDVQETRFMYIRTRCGKLLTNDVKPDKPSANKVPRRTMSGLVNSLSNANPRSTPSRI
jgi:hypothetical protein